MEELTLEIHFVNQSENKEYVSNENHVAEQHFEDHLHDNILHPEFDDTDFQFRIIKPCKV